VNDRPLTIAMDEEVVLPDGIGLTIAGQPVRLAGRHIVTLDGQPFTGTVGDAAVVPAPVEVTRSNGITATLTENLQGTLLDSGPMPTLHRSFFAGYGPSSTAVPSGDLTPHPVEDLDFTTSGAYAGYNWELFFHVPMLIAVTLSRSGRYEESMRWFHYLFDPTNSSSQLSPERYWRVKPFQSTDVERIEEILVNLSTGDNPVLQRDTINAIAQWKQAPFRPHVVARFRQSAYMVKTVMAYLDNLIAWGDSLFRQDTGEAIDEAMQRYVTAANILGPRPQVVPSKGSTRPQTYAELRPDLDELGNAMRFVEGSLLLDLVPPPGATAPDGGLVTLRNLGRVLYFGVPRNDNLMRYWDVVADRLFKIRNSLNLQGVFRRLPLFEPPIDPAMLARATAAGVSVDAIIGGLAQPPTHVRFAELYRQAVDAAQAAVSLGGAVLAATEKEDGEAMSVLRARHERQLLELGEQVRYAQLQESVKSHEAVVATMHGAITRYAYYERQLGVDLEDIKVPELDDLDLAALAKFALRVEEPLLIQRDVPMDIATDVVSEAGGRILSRFEAEELAKNNAARTITDLLKIAQLAGQGIALLPDFGVKFHFWGLGGDAKFGGSQLSEVAKFVADGLAAVADRFNYEAGVAAKVGSYWRREQEWAQQSSQTAAEINQIFKQMRAAQLRVAISDREWRNQQVQSKQAREIEQFLNAEGQNAKGKAGNQALYAWSKRETRGLYTRTLAQAQDLARKAEIAMQHELVLDARAPSYIKPSYEGGRDGLLGGENLVLDLRTMEAAYSQLNVREDAMTRHIALSQLDPMALLTLRATGSCTFEVPEEWFDLDAPGYYLRRIRSVALSIPCVTGPYTCINCRVVLTKSLVRSDAVVQGDLLPDQLVERKGAVTEMVASSARDDRGVFDAPGDDRALPFELAGAISAWSLSLPGAGPDGVRVFDYDSISDVVLHLQLTARFDAELAKAAVKRLDKLKKGDGAVGRVRLLSVRHEFPSEWAAYAAAEGDEAPLTLTLRPEHFPYWAGGQVEVENVELFVPPPRAGVDVEPVPLPDGTPTPALDTSWTVQLDPSLPDIWLLATWKV
jgi:hypothetical protein